MARLPARALAGGALLLTTAAAMAQFNTVRGPNRFAPAAVPVSTERIGDRGEWLFGTGCFPNELRKLTAADGGADDEFGSSADASGDVLVIGAPTDADNGVFSGSAYVFRFDGDTWQQEQKLTASDASQDDWFGVDVSIDGDVIVVGAGEAGDSTGLVYVFRYDGASWIQEARISALDAASFDGFGYAVALSDDTLAVGAPGVNEGRGAAYVYQYDGNAWNEIEKVVSAAGDPCDYMGCPVRLSGDILIAGAFEDDDNGAGAGAAYVFERNRGGPNNWGLRKKLVSSDIEAGDYFGVAIAVDGERALIASRLDGFGAGSAYIFERTHGGPNNWGEVTKLSASDAQGGDQFGWSLDLLDNVAVVGARFGFVQGTRTGSLYAYYYDGQTWSQVAKLTSSDAMQGDAFGSAVALAGDVLVIGAALDDDRGDASGSAYVFRGLGDCNENSTLDICDIDSGTSQDVNNNGIPDECECDPCDMNCDGGIDALDIEPFLDLLFGPNPDPCDTCTGDVNGDGSIDALDIEPFLQCLFP